MLPLGFFLREAFQKPDRVSWRLTSPFSTNMAISETKGQGWRARARPDQHRKILYKWAITVYKQSR